MASNPPYDDDWSGQSINLETGEPRMMATEMTPEQAEKLVQEALKQKIAEKREEIDWMNCWHPAKSDAAAVARILAVLESQLAELMRGCKEQP